MIINNTKEVEKKLGIGTHEGYLLVPQEEPKPVTDKCMIANPIPERILNIAR
jgi:hypothetical protein